MDISTEVDGKVPSSAYVRDDVVMTVNRWAEPAGFMWGDDPWEMTNLADNTQQAALLISLKKQLAEWCKTPGDSIPLKSLT